jgi:ATP-dependent DNA helicase RecG
MRLVEQIGSGITRIRDVMKDEGLTAPEFSIDGMFTVTLRRPFDFYKCVNNLSEKQILIITEIHNNTSIKKSNLQQLVGFSAAALDNNIEVLNGEGLLEREGTKGGIWIIHYINPKVGE